jgi:steroid delta-isomerase-like uncharacterized protein
VSVVWLDDEGKVKREEMYFDMRAVMGQLGKLPKGVPFRAAEALPTAAPETLSADPSADKNEALVKQLFELMNKGDDKAMLALYADDVVMSAQYMPADEKGKKAMEKSHAEGKKAFPDSKMAIVGTCAAAGAQVACRTEWTATFKGKFMGMKPTGKSGTVHGVDVLTVKDGKVTALTAYGNGEEFMAAFGIQ